MIHDSRQAIDAIDAAASAVRVVRKPVTASEMVAWLSDLDRLIQEHKTAV